MFLTHKVKWFSKHLQNMGMDTLKTLRQGKYFEIDIKENNEIKAKEKIEICAKNF